MHKGEPDRFVGARMNVPLIVGLGDGEAFIASDAAAILSTRAGSCSSRRVTLRMCGRGRHDHRDRRLAAGARGDRVTWTPEAAEKGGYAHFMLKEMTEQPQALLSAITGRVTREGRIHLDELDAAGDMFRSVNRIELVGLRDSVLRVACRRNLLQALDRAAGAIDRGSEFRYRPPPLERADARRRRHAVRRDGRHDRAGPAGPRARLPGHRHHETVGSAITREADAVLFLQAGPEVAVAASKTFVTQVALLVMLAAAIGRIRERCRWTGDRARAGAAAAARAGPAGDELAAGSPAMARRYVNSRGFMFVGRGVTYPTALEGALKLKEVSYVHAEGYAAGEFKHGPISLLDAEVPLVAVATRSATYDKLISNVMEGRARDARVIAVAIRRRRADRTVRRRRPVGAGDPRSAVGHPGRHPAPVLRLPHGRCTRHGRGPAAQPREVGHRRVTPWRRAGPRSPRTRNRRRLPRCGRRRVPAVGTRDGRTRRRPGPSRPSCRRDHRARDRHHQGQRIRDALARFGARFSARVLTPEEQRYVRDRPETLAGRWAAKEAVSKVLGLGVRGIGWRDIEIERLPTGQPAVRLHGRAAARAQQLGMDRVAVSISHESEYAVAIAFGVRTAGGRFLFPPDIEERLDDRERRILARMDRLRGLGSEEVAR